MRHLTLVAALIALVSSLSAPIAAADGRTHDRKTKDVVHGEAQDSADHGKSEKKQAERRGEKNKNKVRDTIRDESDDDLSLIHIPEPTRPPLLSRMPSSA